MKRLSDLCTLLNGTLIGPDTDYTGVSIDTRTLKPGELFIAICGKRFDGHDFLDAAVKAGAAGALVHKHVESESPVILVKDTRLSLGQIAKNHRNQFKTPLIALTGSCGKTTTKEMIASILRQKGSTLATQGNQNNDIGVPLTLLQISAAHEYVVVEMGTNQPGDIAYTSNLAHPQIALITSIGLAHLEGLGNVAGVLKAKSEIAQGLPADGLMIVNIDDIPLKQWRELIPHHKLITFGLKRHADFTCQNVHFDDTKTDFTLASQYGSVNIKLPFPGKHNVANALAAGALACSLGISLELIKAGLEQVTAIQGRLTVMRLSSGTLIVDDTYNANPTSVSAALAYLSHFKKRQIFVLGDLAELGEQAKQLHGQIGHEMNQLKIDSLYTIGTMSHYAYRTFKGAGQHFTNETDLIMALREQLDNETVILVKGSRSACMEKIIIALADNKS